MNAWLFDIIKDGHLKDNQKYIFQGQTVKNSRLPSGYIQLCDVPKRRTKAEHYEDKIWEFLCAISQEIQQQVLSNNGALTLFNDEEYERSISGGFIDVTGTYARSFTLTTNNLIGFVKRGNYSLKVSSRFGDAFLRYIISDADGFLELDNFGGESVDDGYEWLLAYLWNVKLKKGLSAGLA